MISALSDKKALLLSTQDLGDDAPDQPPRPSSYSRSFRYAIFFSAFFRQMLYADDLAIWPPLPQSLLRWMSHKEL